MLTDHSSASTSVHSIINDVDGSGMLDGGRWRILLEALVVVAVGCGLR